MATDPKGPMPELATLDDLLAQGAQPIDQAPQQPETATLDQLLAQGARPAAAPALPSAPQPPPVDLAPDPAMMAKSQYQLQQDNNAAFQQMAANRYQPAPGMAPEDADLVRGHIQDATRQRQQAQDQYQRDLQARNSLHNTQNLPPMRPYEDPTGGYDPRADEASWMAARQGNAQQDFMSKLVASRRQAFQQWLDGLPQIPPDSTTPDIEAGQRAQQAYLAQNPLPRHLIDSDPDPQAMLDAFRSKMGIVGQGDTTGEAATKAVAGIPGRAKGMVAGLIQQAARAIPNNPFTGRILNHVLPQGADYPAAAEHTLEQSRQELSDQAAQEGQEFQPNPVTLGGKAAVKGIEMGEGLAPILAGGALAGPAGAAMAAGLQSLGTTTDNTYRTLKSQGVDDTTARNRANTEGVVSGAANGAMMLLMPGGSEANESVLGILKKTARDIVTGRPAAIGAATSLINDTVAHFGHDQKFDEGTVQRALQSALDFSILHTGFGGIEALKAKAGGMPMREVAAAEPPPPETPPDLSMRESAPAKQPPASEIRVQWTDDAGNPIQGIAQGQAQGMVAVRADDGALHQVPQDRLTRITGNPALAPPPAGAAARRELTGQGPGKDLGLADAERAGIHQLPEPPDRAPAQMDPADLAAALKGVQEDNASGGQLPSPILTEKEIRTRSSPKLKEIAQSWGVPFDTRSLTIPRILDAQERWRTNQLTDQQLYQQVKGLGLRASNRQANIETLIQAGQYAGGTPSNKPPFTPGTAEAESPPAPLPPRPAQAPDQLAPALQQPETAPPASAIEQSTLPARQGALGSDTPVLSKAFRSNDIIYLSFDAMHPAPSVEEIRNQLAAHGLKPHEVSVVAFNPDISSAAEGSVKYRIDVGGPGSTDRAASIYRAMTGGDEPLRNPTTFQDSLTPEQRIKAGLTFARNDIGRGMGIPPEKFDQAGQPLTRKETTDERQKEARRQEVLTDQGAPAQSDIGPAASSSYEGMKYGDLIKTAKAKGMSPPWVSAEKLRERLTGPEESAPAVEKKPTPRAAAGFSRDALRAKLIDHYEQMTGDTAHEERMAEEAGGTFSSFTFYKKLPGEVKDFLSGHPEARGVFKVSDSPSGTGGEDAMHSMGDRYWEVARRFGEKKITEALKLARKDDNPEIQFLAALHDNLPPKAEKVSQTAIKTDKLTAGNEFEINGHKFRVVENADGMRVLRDGKDYPELPLDHVDKLPMDKGTLVQGKPVTEKKFFDAGKAGVSKEQTGIFGQPEILAKTGRQEKMAFETERQPGTVPQGEKLGASAEAMKPENTGEMFGDAAPETKIVGDGGVGGRRAAGGSPREPRKPVEPKTEMQEALYGKRSFVGRDVIPKAIEVAKAIREVGTQARSAFDAANRTDQSKIAGGIVREMNARLAQRAVQLEESLKKASAFFDRQSDADNLAFIKKMEAGSPQGDVNLHGIAKGMRDILDSRVQQVRSLGAGKLEQFIQNYFPHLWADPAKASEIFSVIAKKPMEGSKSFLKKRSIPTVEAGVAAGLEPITYNPADLVMLKAREMDRYIFAQKAIKAMHEAELLKFVGATKKPPEGLAKIDDRIAQVYGPPTIDVKEYVNKSKWDAMNQVLDNLGVSHERKMKAGRGILGYSVQGGDQIVSQFGTGESVVAHELSHQLDDKYDLQTTFLRNPRKSVQAELRALGDLKIEGTEPSKGRLAYVRKGEEKMAHLLEAYMEAPERMKEVAPTVYKMFDKFLADHEELVPLRNFKASLAKEELQNQISHGGLLKYGEYMAPEAVANLINNHLSPGLRSKSGAFRIWNGLANFQNMVTLGASAFHGATSAVNSVISQAAQGIQDLSRGELLSGGKRLISLPAAPFMQAYMGDKLVRELRSPGPRDTEIARLADAVIAAGGRSEQDPLYKTQLTDGMMKEWRKSNYTGAALRALGVPLEQLNRPIMEWMVPRLKLGAFADLARTEMEKLGPDATREQVREVMGKAWNSIDNRFGQVVHDNYFWPKTVKELAMAVTRSVGWNLGTYRELGGAGVDAIKQLVGVFQGKRPEVTHKMAYAIALPFVAGVMGALYQYGKTGKPPDDMRDLFFPRTGETSPDGREIRTSLPTYMKDVYGFSSNPGKTILGKLHPTLTMVSDMLQNKDFYGTQIRNPDEPAMKQLLDEVKYVGKSFTPISVTGMQKAGEEKQKSPLDKALPFVGFPEAPASVSMTPAERIAQDIAVAENPHAARTKEQFERSQARKDLSQQLRAHDPAFVEDIHQALKTNGITPYDAQVLAHENGQSRLEGSLHTIKEPEQMMKVWDAASPAERKKILPIIVSRLVHSKILLDGQKKAIFDKLGIKPLSPQ